MNIIKEIVVEPNKVYVGSTFKLKVKIEDNSLTYRNILSENGRNLLTEDRQEILTEWSV